MKTYKLVVHGRVQGVWYRKSVEDNAKKMGLKGWVQNMPDSTVKVAVNLSKGQVDTFIQKLYEGSMLSKVTKVDKEVLEFINFNKFEIRR